jgi:transposase
VTAIEPIHENLPSAPTGAEEDLMINHDEWCIARSLFKQGLSKTAIARHLGFDPKTVRKWLSSSWQPQRRNRKRPLEKFDSFIRARAPEVGFNAAVLLRELRALGYSGSYPALVRYIRPLRRAALALLEPTPRFETDPGEQSQVDWGSTSVFFEQAAVRVHLFVMVLGYSRRIFTKAYLNERLDALLEAHSSAFAHFGGHTRKILYDNPRTIVLDKDEHSGQITWNPVFKDRMDFYGIDIQLCRYYRACTKGKVESGVKYVKRNALAGRRFRDLNHLNEWLFEWSVSVADERIHGTTHERPSERFRRAEAEALVRVEGRVVPVRERVETRVVPRDGLVVVETNRYPVPLEWVGQQVEVRLQPQQIIICRADQQQVSYCRLTGKFELADWNGAPRSYARLPLSAASGPPRFDLSYRLAVGEVESRELACYEALVEEVRG